MALPTMSATELPPRRSSHASRPAPVGGGRPIRRQILPMVAAGVTGAAFAAAMIYVAWTADGHSLAVSQGSVPAFVVAAAIGVSFLAAGLAVWWHRPESRVGPLMVAAGTLWYVSDLQSTGSPVLYAIGYWLTYLPPVVVGHLTLAYPEGRLRRRAERWAVLASYVTYLSLQGVRYLHEGLCHHIGLPGPGDELCGTSILPSLVSFDAIFFDTLFFVWVLRRWRMASAPARRVHGPAWLAFSLISVALAGSALSYLVHLPEAAQLLFVLGYGVCMLVLPFAFLSGMLRVRLARLRVSDLVLALDETIGPARLRQLLAATLEDPTLELGYWSETSGDYVDAGGRPVAAQESPSARAVTFVERRGRRLAVLVHDPSLVEQQPLVRAVVATARLAIENARLEALLNARVEELEASRARLAEAALNERRTIERDLHDGLQHRLLRLSWLADRAGAVVDVDGGARPALAELADEARDAYSELRELARGIHPAILTERGLRAAVEELALGTGVPVLVDLPDERWPRPVEATAFFTISEALTNAAKHSRAERVTVRGRRTPGLLTIQVADDGAGGADPLRGTGLRGLHDRAAALGGTLTIDSAAGRGTRLVLELPCE
jgi:signal transduction histidine kinase